MTVAATEPGLFAAKGRATPVGYDAATPADALADVRPVAALAEAQPPEAMSEARADSPAGSLLTFQLRSTPEKPALSEELKSALAGPKAVEPARALQSAAPDMPMAAAGPANPVAVPDEAASLPMAAAPSACAAAARIDQPLFPRARSERDAVLATRPAARSIEVRPPSAWRTALPIGGAVLAIAAVGWLVSSSEAPVPVAQPAQPTEIAPSPALAAEAASPMVAGAAASGASTPADGAAVAPTATDSPAAAETSSAVVPLPPDAPSFEVVRVAPDAPPVLAGRAAPGSELIVLDNGAVIGTARADASGDWALVTDKPLPAGRHELTLALATPEGAVVIEQADTLAPPAAGNPEDLPVPTPKPAAGAADAQLYMVQLASVPSAVAAEREWTRLRQAHPDQLGAAAVEIDAVELGDRGTFHRVRTGPFADRNAARALCRQLNAAGQECLVIRQAAGE